MGAVTMAVLVVTEAGQPALLYLVPATLGSTLLLGFRRGDLHALFEGIPEDNSVNSEAPCASGVVAVVDWQPCAIYRPHRGQPDQTRSEKMQQEMRPVLMGSARRESA